MKERFDFLEQGTEWSRENLKEFERIAGLSAKLWGNAENLKRQLELPSPKVPAGLGMKELLILEQRARMMVSGRHPCLPKLPIIASGDEHFSTPEAMYEIVRRAIAAALSN